MIKPPPVNWEYVLIELEIDGNVVDSRIANHGTYERMLTFLIAVGEAQSFPWAVFISKQEFKLNKKHRLIDMMGKFLHHRLFNLNK